MADRLGVKRDADTILLADAVHDVPRHPQVVARINSFAWTDLVLPLPGHHFGICSSNLHSSPLIKVRRQTRNLEELTKQAAR